MLPGRAYGTTTYTPHLGPTPPRGPLAHPARAGALGGTGVAAGSVRRERAKRAEEGKSFQKPTIIGTIHHRTPDGAGRAALAPDRYRSFRLTYATVFVAATRERGTGSCPGSAGQHE